MTDQPDTATYRRALDSTGWHHYDADDWRRIVDALDAARAEYQRLGNLMLVAEERAEAAEDDLTIAVRALDAAKADYRLMEVAEQNRSEQLAAAEAELRAAHQVLAIARNWRDQERTQPPTVGQMLLFMAIAEHDAGRTA